MANLTCFSGKCPFIQVKCSADTKIMTIVLVKSGLKTICEQKSRKIAVFLGEYVYFCTRVDDFM